MPVELEQEAAAPSTPTLSDSGEQSDRRASDTDSSAFSLIDSTDIPNPAGTLASTRSSHAVQGEAGGPDEARRVPGGHGGELSGAQSLPSSTHLVSDPVSASAIAAASAGPQPSTDALLNLLNIRSADEHANDTLSSLAHSAGRNTSFDCSGLSAEDSEDSVIISYNTSSQQVSSAFLRDLDKTTSDEASIVQQQPLPKPIPALHGPSSLPYARCPSGAEGVVIERPEDPSSVVWGLNPECPPFTLASRARSPAVISHPLAESGGAKDRQVIYESGTASASSVTRFPSNQPHPPSNIARRHNQSVSSQPTSTPAFVTQPTNVFPLPHGVLPQYDFTRTRTHLQSTTDPMPSRSRFTTLSLPQPQGPLVVPISVRQKVRSVHHEPLDLEELRHELALEQLRSTGMPFTSSMDPRLLADHLTSLKLSNSPQAQNGPASAFSGMRGPYAQPSPASLYHANLTSCNSSPYQEMTPFLHASPYSDSSTFSPPMVVPPTPPTVSAPLGSYSYKSFSQAPPSTFGSIFPPVGEQFGVPHTGHSERKPSCEAFLPAIDPAIAAVGEQIKLPSLADCPLPALPAHVRQQQRQLRVVSDPYVHASLHAPREPSRVELHPSAPGGLGASPDLARARVASESAGIICLADLRKPARTPAQTPVTPASLPALPIAAPSEPPTRLSVGPGGGKPGLAYRAPRSIPLGRLMQQQRRLPSVPEEAASPGRVGLGLSLGGARARTEEPPSPGARRARQVSGPSSPHQQQQHVIRARGPSVEDPKGFRGRVAPPTRSSDTARTPAVTTIPTTPTAVVPEVVPAPAPSFDPPPTATPAPQVAGAKGRRRAGPRPANQKSDGTGRQTGRLQQRASGTQAEGKADASSKPASRRTPARSSTNGKENPRRGATRPRAAGADGGHRSQAKSAAKVPVAVV